MRRIASLLARVALLAAVAAAFASPARAAGVCPTRLPAGVWCDERICYVPRAVFVRLSIVEKACGKAELRRRGLIYRVVGDR